MGYQSGRQRFAAGGRRVAALITTMFVSATIMGLSLPRIAAAAQLAPVQNASLLSAGNNPWSPATPMVALDGVTLNITTPYIPTSAWAVNPPDDAIQVASSNTVSPYRELTVVAAPFGTKPPTEATLGIAAAGGAPAYLKVLAATRASQGGSTAPAPPIEMFGQVVTGIVSTVAGLPGSQSDTTLIAEWVGEGGNRLWILRASLSDLTGSTSLLTPSTFASRLQTMRLNSPNVNAPSTSVAAGVAAARLAQEKGAVTIATPLSPTKNIQPLSATTVSAPSWWNGQVCDHNYYYAGSGGWNSYVLGSGAGVWRNLSACGPRPWCGPGFECAPDVLQHFFSGAYGTFEFECVELSLRWLYLEYHQSPYSGNGSQIVWNYPGSALVKVHNNGTSLPSPGDVLSYGSTSTTGHTSVVTAITSTSVSVIEQNSSPGGLTTFGVTNGVLGGIDGGVNGWLHDPQGAGASTVTAASDPVVIQGGPNGMDLFVTGADGFLYHKWYNSGTWYGWENLGQPGAAVTGDVSVIVESAGTAAIFARGTDGSLSIRNSHPGGWDAWARIASNDGGDPVAGVGSGFNSADVYYRDSVTNAVDSTWWNGTGWSTAAIPGGQLQGKPAVREAGGVVEVTVRGTTNEVWSTWFTGSWSGWADRHGQTLQNPTTATTSAGEIDLFVPSTNNSTPYSCNESAGCSWTAMAGTVTNSDIAPVRPAPDTQNDMTHASDGSLYYIGNLTYGYSLGGVVVGTPAAVGTPSAYRFDTFVRGTDNSIYWNYFSGGWSGFISMGTQITGSN